MCTYIHLCCIYVYKIFVVLVSQYSFFNPFFCHNSTGISVINLISLFIYIYLIHQFYIIIILILYYSIVLYITVLSYFYIAFTILFVHLIKSVVYIISNIINFQL